MLLLPPLPPPPPLPVLLLLKLEGGREGGREVLRVEMFARPKMLSLLLFTRLPSVDCSPSFLTCPSLLCLRAAAAAAAAAAAVAAAVLLPSCPPHSPRSFFLSPPLACSHHHHHHHRRSGGRISAGRPGLLCGRKEGGREEGVGCAAAAVACLS